MKNKLIVKIFAVLLCIITSLGAVASGFSVLFMEAEGMYDKTDLTEAELQKEFLNVRGYTYDNDACMWLYDDLLMRMNSWQFFYDEDEVLELAGDYIETNFPKNDEYFGISILDDEGETLYSSFSSYEDISDMSATEYDVLLYSSLEEYMDAYGYVDSYVEYYVEVPDENADVTEAEEENEEVTYAGDDYEDYYDDYVDADTVETVGSVTEAENETETESEADEVTEPEASTVSTAADADNVTVIAVEDIDKYYDDGAYYELVSYNIRAVEIYSEDGSGVIYKNESPEDELNQMFYMTTTSAVKLLGRNRVAGLVMAGRAYLYTYNTYEDMSTYVTRAAQVEQFEGSTRFVTDNLYSNLSDEERVISFNIYTNNAVIIENYNFTYGLFSTMYSLRYALIGIFAGCVLVFIISFIYLLCACGHRTDADGVDVIRLNAVDKIPSDIYLAILFIAAIAVLNAASYYAEEIIAIGAVYIAFLLGFMAVLSVATRLKAGCFIKDALLYRGCGWLGTRLFAVIKSLPLIWKWAIIGAVLLAINVIIFCFCFDYEGLLALIGIVVDIAIYLGILLFLASYAKIETAAQKMAEGDLNYQLDTNHLYGGLKEQGENMNLIGNNLGLAVEEQMKSERMKTELITNVSHDIKTPLTSIINYVDLLKKEEMPSETSVQYLEVIDRQSARLKKLIVDLIEASKASSGNVEIEPVMTDVNELLVQTTAEYESRCQEKNLEMVLNLLPETAHILVDGRHIWRVLDNILGNAYKYSLENTRIYIDVTRRDGQICISFKNVSATPLNISADELLERFVRGDSSRNTEGSGLGLSIAKSLTELQGGEFKLEIDGDLFKCEMTFPEIKNEKS